MFADYAAAAPGEVDYHEFEVADSDANARARAIEAGALRGAIGDTEGFRGIVFRYGAQSDVTRWMGDAGRLKYEVARKVRRLRELVEGRQHEIGILTGHGEIGVRESLVGKSMGPGFSLKDILASYDPFYVLEDVEANSLPHGPAGPIEGLSCPERSAKKGGDETVTNLRRRIVSIPGQPNSARGTRGGLRIRAGGCVPAVLRGSGSSLQ